MILRGTFFSSILGMETNIAFAAPDHILQKPLKSVYLLHGLGGRSGDWLDHSCLPSLVNDHQLVYIMPDGGRSFYSDQKFGLKYFTYLTNELPGMAQSLFHISDKKEDTAIIGASMGGYGALKAVLTLPDRYGFCGAFSSPCLSMKKDLEMVGSPENFKTLFGEALLADFMALLGPSLTYDSNLDILELINRNGNKVKDLHLYLTCGTNDPFYRTHQQFSTMLQKSPLSYTYEEWEGNHDWDFFFQSLKKAVSTWINTDCSITGKLANSR